LWEGTGLGCRAVDSITDRVSVGIMLRSGVFKAAGMQQGSGWKTHLWLLWKSQPGRM